MSPSAGLLKDGRKVEVGVDGLYALFKNNTGRIETQAMSFEPKDKRRSNSSEKIINASLLAILGALISLMLRSWIPVYSVVFGMLFYHLAIFGFRYVNTDPVKKGEALDERWKRVRGSKDLPSFLASKTMEPNRVSSKSNKGKRLPVRFALPWR